MSQVTVLLGDNTHSTTISKFINDRWCWRIKMLLAQKKESSPESFIKASHKHLSVSNCCQVKLGKRHNYPNYKIGAKFKFHSTVNLQSGLWQRLKPHHHHHHHHHRHDHHYHHNHRHHHHSHHHRHQQPNSNLKSDSVWNKLENERSILLVWNEFQNIEACVYVALKWDIYNLFGNPIARWIFSWLYVLYICVSRCISLKSQIWCVVDICVFSFSQSSMQFFSIVISYFWIHVCSDILRRRIHVKYIF